MAAALPATDNSFLSIDSDLLYDKDKGLIQSYPRPVKSVYLRCKVQEDQVTKEYEARINVSYVAYKIPHSLILHVPVVREHYVDGVLDPQKTEELESLSSTNPESWMFKPHEWVYDDKVDEKERSKKLPRRPLEKEFSSDIIHRNTWIERRKYVESFISPLNANEVRVEGLESPSSNESESYARTIIHMPEIGGLSCSATCLSFLFLVFGDCRRSIPCLPNFIPRICFTQSDVDYLYTLNIGMFGYMWPFLSDLMTINTQKDYQFCVDNVLQIAPAWCAADDCFLEQPSTDSLPKKDATISSATRQGVKHWLSESSVEDKSAGMVNMRQFLLYQHPPFLKKGEYPSFRKYYHFTDSNLQSYDLETLSKHPEIMRIMLESYILNQDKSVVDKHILEFVIHNHYAVLFDITHYKAHRKEVCLASNRYLNHNVNVVKLGVISHSNELNTSFYTPAFLKLSCINIIKCGFQSLFWKRSWNILSSFTTSSNIIVAPCEIDFSFFYDFHRHFLLDMTIDSKDLYYNLAVSSLHRPTLISKFSSLSRLESCLQPVLLHEKRNLPKSYTLSFIDLCKLSMKMMNGCLLHIKNDMSKAEPSIQSKAFTVSTYKKDFIFYLEWFLDLQEISRPEKKEFINFIWMQLYLNDLNETRLDCEFIMKKFSTLAGGQTNDEELKYSSKKNFLDNLIPFVHSSVRHYFHYACCVLDKIYDDYHLHLVCEIEKKNVSNLGVSRFSICFLAKILTNADAGTEGTRKLCAFIDEFKTTNLFFFHFTDVVKADTFYKFPGVLTLTRLKHCVAACVKVNPNFLRNVILIQNLCYWFWLYSVHFENMYVLLLMMNRFRRFILPQVPYSKKTWFKSWWILSIHNTISDFETGNVDNVSQSLRNPFVDEDLMSNCFETNPDQHHQNMTKMNKLYLQNRFLGNSQLEITNAPYYIPMMTELFRLFMWSPKERTFLIFFLVNHFAKLRECYSSSSSSTSSLGAISEQMTLWNKTYKNDIRAVQTHELDQRPNEFHSFPNNLRRDDHQVNFVSMKTYNEDLKYARQHHFSSSDNTFLLNELKHRTEDHHSFSCQLPYYQEPDRQSMAHVLDVCEKMLCHLIQAKYVSLDYVMRIFDKEKRHVPFSLYQMCRYTGHNMSKRPALIPSFIHVSAKEKRKNCSNDKEGKEETNAEPNDCSMSDSDSLQHETFSQIDEEDAHRQKKKSKGSASHCV